MNDTYVHVPQNGHSWHTRLYQQYQWANIKNSWGRVKLNEIVNAVHFCLHTWWPGLQMIQYYIVILNKI